MPDPEPLTAPDEEPKPYPLDALPPTIRAAVSAYQRFGQQPISLVASSALSVAALATQGLVNVGRDKNLIGPISLNLAVIAESGERKTSADRRMRQGAQHGNKTSVPVMSPKLQRERAGLPRGRRSEKGYSLR